MPFFKRKRNAAAEENPSAIGEKKAIPRKKAAKGEFIEVATNNIKEIERIHIPFDELLSKVQQYMSTKYSVDLYRSDNRELMKQLIQQYMKDNNYYVPNMILKEVSDKLYTEMAEYSLLTQYLRNPHIEEININGWDDITVIPAHGERFKVQEPRRLPCSRCTQAAAPPQSHYMGLCQAHCNGIPRLQYPYNRRLHRHLR